MEKKKRIRPKIGDVFEVVLKNKTKGYVQYIGNDIEQLNSDVVRVFKTRYSADHTPDLKDVVKDGVEFYAHVTGVEFGVVNGEWERIGNINQLGDLKAPLFRDPGDGSERRDGELHFWPKISKSWYIWRMGQKKTYVEKLEGENIKADMGLVIWPDSVIERMETGKYSGFYPDYK